MTNAAHLPQQLPLGAAASPFRPQRHPTMTSQSQSSSPEGIEPHGPRVVPTTAEHEASLAADMREEDRAEVWHLARVLPATAIRNGVSLSAHARTVLLGDDVVCIFGVCDAGNGAGVPWMLASNHLTRIRKTFVRECREQLNEMSQGFSVLMNFAWAKNTAHIDWLHWLGFEIAEALPMGPDSELFHLVTKATHV